MKSLILIFILSFVYIHSCWGLFNDGEVLTYEIRYGRLTAGEAKLEISKSEYRGQEVYVIRSLASTNSFFDKIFRVRDEIESISIYDSFESLVFTKRLQEGKYRQHRIHQNFLQQNFSIYSSFRFGAGEWEEVRIEIPSTTYDLLSAFYMVRTRELEIGDVIDLPLTVDGKNYDASVKVLRKEKIKTVLGEIECLVVEPGLAGEAIFQQTGDIHIWLTNDERKIPVLLQSKIIFGHFRAILK